MSTTRWTDTATDDLNTAVDLLIDTVANDERVSTLTWDNWQLSKAYDKTQTMILNGRNIKYNFINYSYQPLSAYLFSNLLISNPDIASPKFSDNSANLTGSL